jgi:hypothetical protein
MPHAVPSQVRDLISSLFPDAPKEQSAPGQAGIYVATRVRAVLDLLDKIPDELIRLTPQDSALYWANVSALQSAWEDRNKSQNAILVSPVSPSGYRPLTEVFNYLAKCPDDAPAAQTRGLEFIEDTDLRDVLRTDTSSANSALMNHEYKPATVVAGSVVEALLLWALEQRGDANVRKAWSSAPVDPLDRWTLGPMIHAAHVCKVITDDTRKAAELAQNYRNLIHPGKAARLKEKCDRGTALAALAAIERVAADLEKAFP